MAREGLSDALGGVAGLAEAIAVRVALRPERLGVRPAPIGIARRSTVRLSARWAEEGDFLRAESQAVAAVLEISLQIAKARSREARR